MKNARFPHAGFTLVEITLAVGITVFCLAALLGVLPVGLRNNLDARSQTAAVGILSSVSSDLRATPACVPPGQASVTSLQYGVTIPANPVTVPVVVTAYFDADGKKVTQPTDAIYRLSITFTANGNPRTATFADLKLTWPAQAAVTNAAGSVEHFVALDRN